jgi:hypothetical protein
MVAEFEAYTLPLFSENFSLFALRSPGAASVANI